MERTGTIGVEQMTDKKPEVQKVLDKFAQKVDKYNSWKELVKDFHDYDQHYPMSIYSPKDLKQLASLAFEQGKLAAYEITLKQIEEGERKMCQWDVEVALKLWLKSQIKDSEESHSSRPFAPKRKLEAKK